MPSLLALHTDSTPWAVAEADQLLQSCQEHPVLQKAVVPCCTGNSWHPEPLPTTSISPTFLHGKVMTIIKHILDGGDLPRRTLMLPIHMVWF